MTQHQAMHDALEAKVPGEPEDKGDGPMDPDPPRGVDLASATRIGAVVGVSVFVAGLLIGVALPSRTPSIPEVSPLAPVVASPPPARDSAMVAALIPLVGGPVVGLTEAETIALVLHLERVEGYRPTVYTDATGHRTIGIGSNLDSGPGMPRSVALLWALATVGESCAKFAAGWPSYHEAPQQLRSGLCDFSYQLGYAGALSFHHALTALGGGRCVEATVDFRDSEWARQTPGRAQRLEELISEYGCGS